MPKQINSKLAIIISITLFVIASGYMYVIFKYTSISFPTFPGFPRIPFPPFVSEIEGVEKFSSEEDFKVYLQEAELGYYGGFVGLGGATMRPLVEEGLPVPTAPLEFEAKGAIPERVSETTVQVLGIDEPDIVKTDGKEIYFSSGESYYWRGFMEVIPPKIIGETKIIKAFPPADLAIDAKIDKKGDLLLKGDILVIFSGEKIYGYDISDPESPEKEWTIELEDKNYVVSARLYKDKIYLITKTKIDTYHPCPIRPLTVEGVPLEIKCIDIYHPVPTIPVDVTYNAIIFNPDSGEIENTVSFVGSSDLSIVYMSEDAIHVTYSYYASIIKFFSNFFKEKCKDIVPDWLIEKLEKLEGYDISDTAKLMEFQVVLERYFNSLSSDERLRIENEFENRMGDYHKAHKRDFETTGIIKIGLDKFEVSATGNVPGRPLNQFSLDEYNDFLRVATTVGGGGFWWGIGGTRESANDIYILDKDLKRVGSLQDLGLEERIYSVRFIEDKGYVVTFKQIDPFFVLDLSNPKKPELKGELKIPGYSSYLHPITKDKILGIGKEGSKVKISLFDVAQPQKPTETDKYTLDEYWSDILNTHHAFLLDKKHQIFFLPGSRGGYVFSYKGNQLELTRAVSSIRARRAVYIEDLLYIIGDDKVVVLNELNWEKVNEIEF
ncbi:beta-propeller domain-containing protein [Patescibacteria group bacterium]|nr:beta-propeller domain-containing protein [Patescibacteria group bacterium]